MTDIILLSDPRVAATRVIENGEPLVDTREVAALRVDTRKTDDDGSYAHLRADVLRRLLLAQDALPPGIRLLMVEGFRPPALQRRYFDEYAATLRAAHPGAGADRIRELASAYISPPEVAPHVSGGAVDLTLCTDDGAELPLGTEVNATPEESEGGCRTAALNIDAVARAGREVMGRAMTAAGFVNYPTEWWHWSYGDRYWALLTQAPTAKYGPASLRPTTV
ncbi:M15 family metallopeptidase [Streptomyces fulvorobeus]|uniref:D-alanyl-D-alanine dipeptidase n=1 Tax=Streptomyces fulvorobeus TaxID=284028 RepID=A0A7J0CEI4_9ACTN|nr:M15 family metallopeptidase [Streptomyces fulvorobeus]NYE43721.1 D-alanyl-D-alanine dipeptidase [Streptomyces fulvorobeus]GFN00205.1 D-alanyl-D-alanine dipeptidase [Streptomyces fulvorobeus]